MDKYLSGQPDTGKLIMISLWGLRILIALFFIFMAVKNLSGDEKMIRDFARWGYPDWFRILTASLQIIGAILLLFPSMTFYGAILLSCILLGAMVTHIRFDPIQHVVSPLIFVIFTAIIIYSFRPVLLR